MKPADKKREPTIYRDIKDCNLVIELRDIRIPLSSAVGFLDTKFESKKRVIFLTKSDLVTPEYKKSVLSWFYNNKVDVFLIQSTNRNELRKCFQRLVEKYMPKSSLLKVLRVVIVGLPNVGKSTLINCLRGKNVARAANSPGITQGRQWIWISDQCYLLDTPGVATLTHTRDADKKMKFAACRMISDGEYEIEELGLWFFNRVHLSQKTEIFVRGGFEPCTDWQVFLENICRKYSFLASGATPDYARAARKWVDFFSAVAMGDLDLDEIRKSKEKK